MRHGIDGNFGNVGNVKCATYRLYNPPNGSNLILSVPSPGWTVINLVVLPSTRRTTKPLAAVRNGDARPRMQPIIRRLRFASKVRVLRQRTHGDPANFRGSRSDPTRRCTFICDAEQERSVRSRVTLCQIAFSSGAAAQHRGGKIRIHRLRR